ncbi:hypothetical protein JCM8547_004202 [Rhodosporidiobolus lusitaniae]
MSLRGHGVPLPRTPEHMRAAENNPEGNADLSGVLAKLGAFTLAMVLLPIGTYYASRDFVFSGDTTFSAIAAVTVANIILVGFIYIAFREDQLDYEKEKKEKLKEKAKEGKGE